MGVQLFWCCQKQGFFLDEVYSYGLSNGYYTPFMTTIDSGDGFIDKVLSRADLLDYVSVNPGEQFDYSSVYYNQTQDVHPPPFYFLLHTVCSFFPEAFSKWFGLVLNLIVMAATLALLYSLGRKLLKSKWLALAACLLYGISLGGLSTVLMVRMYMLLTLASTALAWVVVVNFEQPKAWHYPLAAAIVFFGMMTQYLFAVYAFFICAVYCGYLLYKRRWRQALSFGGSAVVGLAAMLIAFPSWWAQLHSQSTVSADTALSNFAGGIVFYAKRLAYGIKNVGVSLPVVGVLFLVFYREATDVISRMGISYELLLVNDGSSDGTIEIIRELARKDPCVAYLTFSRNFGKEAAMYAGLRNARGEYVAVMDADMQDPRSYLRWSKYWMAASTIAWPQDVRRGRGNPLCDPGSHVFSIESSTGSPTPTSLTGRATSGSCAGRWSMR